jgi:hypothetical protein
MKYLEVGEKCIMRTASQLVLFAKCNQNNQVKEDEMGMPCSTHGGEEECI